MERVARIERSEIRGRSVQ